MAMTPAERQQRRRAKQKAQAATMAAQGSTGAVMAAQAQQTHLRNRMEAAERSVAELRPMRAERDALQARLGTVRTALAGLLPRLSPAGRALVRDHFRVAGLAEWLDSG